MVKLRLKRMGSKYNAFYRIVAADSRSPRDGKYIEDIGYYNPHSKEIKINEELKNKWLELGAKPTATVKNLFTKVAKLSTDGSLVVLPKKVKKAKVEEVKVDEAVVEETTVEETATEETPAETAEEAKETQEDK